MVTFIIIGCNESWKITKCLESIHETIERNALQLYEVIYVDSKSTDDSIERVQKFEKVKILLLTGDINAAIARNVGAKEAKGDVFFFIDGDMEIFPDLYNFVFDAVTQKLKYPFSNGYWQDKLYDNNFNYLQTNDVIIPNKPEFINVTGGLMIIERTLWEKVEGMDERLIRNEDHDIGLRLSKLGFPAKRYNHLFAIHHTVNYYDKKRSVSFYFSKALLTTGLLMRKHLFNISYLKKYKRNVIYVFFLLIAFIMLFIESHIGFIMFIFYIIIQALRSIKNKKLEQYLFQSFLFKTLYNFYTLFGFLFFFPRINKYSVEELSN